MRGGKLGHFVFSAASFDTSFNEIFFFRMLLSGVKHGVQRFDNHVDCDDSERSITIDFCMRKRHTRAILHEKGVIRGNL